jgi:homoserine dehydrogenase
MKQSVKVALLGYGVVGSGVARVLTQNSEAISTRAGLPVELHRVAEIDPEKAKAADIPESYFTTDSLAVVTDPDIDIIAECIGGVGVARELVEQAIRAGKSVATPNKELMAKHGHALLQLAAENGVDLQFEGSVGGGIPIVRPMKESLAGDDIVSVAGIVNGTTNYILTQMSQEGTSFESALADAQRRGYAEPDPTNDVSGNDAAYKISILASIAFGKSVAVDSISREGIEKMHPRDLEAAADLGFTVKLLAIAKQLDDGRVEARVHPTMIPENHPLAAVGGVSNAVFVRGRYVGDVMFYGPGAGSLPTASAMVGDIVDSARNISQGTTGRVRCVCSGTADVLPAEEVSSGYYLRMTVLDQPGVLGAVATVFGQYGVSLASVFQKRVEGRSAEIVWITHGSKERSFREALQRVEQLPVVERISSTIRVEDV